MSVVGWTAVVFASDFLSKQLALRWLVDGESLSLFGPVQLNLVHNTGAAFGLLSGSGAWLAVTNAIVMVAVFVYGVRSRQRVVRAAAGAVAGGSAGNLLDRLVRGAVVDFVDVGFWPVFNVADTAIVLGWGLLAWLHIRQEKDDRRG